MDEQSVMTYLSQFPKAKLKPGAPLKPKLNPKKARAYGPGTAALPEPGRFGSDAYRTVKFNVGLIHFLRKLEASQESNKNGSMRPAAGIGCRNSTALPPGFLKGTASH